jgi:uncharacterized membrane protein
LYVPIKLTISIDIFKNPIESLIATIPQIGYNLRKEIPMANNKFSIQEALRYGWKTFKSNIPFFIGLMVVMALVTVVPGYVADKLFARGSVGLILAKILVRAVGLLMGMVSTRIALDIYDHGQPNLETLERLLPQIPAYLIGKILYGAIVLVGLILLIVPGVIAAFMFLYVGYLVIDRNYGPVAALGESRVITEGSKWNLFCFGFVIALFNLLGVLCLFVGLVVTIPISLMATVHVYRKLSPAEPVAETA